MFNPSRQDARRFFFDTWARRQQTLSGLEAVAFGVILQHPEYHALLDQAERYLESDWAPEDGQTNPFLHLSLHMAIEEQRSIDQPFGIRSLYAQLALRRGDEHAAQHEIMDCLGEMIWHAQRYGGGPDVNRYIACIRGKLGMGEEETPRAQPHDAPGEAD
ncbi:DUF1841 family protein [Paludibacterium yongneupense]|uniref:DUF1841 family protein n=1 Tax=Paludibacterium yongneupense TaxID=400061 RepID=UPI0004093366|nr:DUF1841 family protein [Paludibacterium yongneupense]